MSALWAGGSFIKKTEGADVGLRGLRNEKITQSTIKILRNVHFSPDFAHFSIKVERALDKLERLKPPQLNKILRPCLWELGKPFQTSKGPWDQKGSNFRKY